MTKNEYDISQYTDKELLTLLDLNENPSDRELEAKIIFNIRKYKNIGGESAHQLAVFFEDIYAHFFELGEEVAEDKETEDEHDEGEGKEEDPQLEVHTNNANLTTRDEGFNNNAPNKNVIVEPQTSRDNEAKVGYTRSLDYTRGQLNPLLQQTIKRVISIDSQYRDNKDALSTEFTFDLSDPLKDVVALKLYSVQIPYTWYTINNDFGSNFFVINNKF